MKRLFIYSAIVVFGLGSCTMDFDELNTDPDNLTEVGARERPFMFAKAQSSSAMNRSFYQTVQYWWPYFYAQYFALTTTSFRTDRYALTPDWQRSFWSHAC